MPLINASILILTFLLLAGPVHAYLDPGSGSFILQLVIGAILGGLVTLKIYFHKFKKFVTGILRKHKKHGNDKPHD